MVTPLAPRQKGRGAPPQFSAHVYCGQTAGCMKVVLGMEVGLGPVHIVLDGHTALLPKKGDRAPHFRPIFIVAKRLDASRCHLVWIEVDLSPGNFVLDGDPIPYPKKGGPHRIFSPRLLWPNGWMDEDAAWYGSRPRPRPHCTRRGPNSRERGKAKQPLVSTHVYCGHGRPSQLLLSSCLSYNYAAMQPNSSKYCSLVSFGTLRKSVCNFV